MSATMDKANPTSGVSENGNEHSREREWMTAAGSRVRRRSRGLHDPRGVQTQHAAAYKDWWRNRRADQDAKRMDRRLAGTLGARRRRPLTCSRALGSDLTIFKLHCGRLTL